jgi:hypothetical protein
MRSRAGAPGARLRWTPGVGSSPSGRRADSAQAGRGPRGSLGDELSPEDCPRPDQAGVNRVIEPHGPIAAAHRLGRLLAPHGLRVRERAYSAAPESARALPHATATLQSSKPLQGATRQVRRGSRWRLGADHDGGPPGFQSIKTPPTETQQTSVTAASDERRLAVSNEVRAAVRCCLWR